MVGLILCVVICGFAFGFGIYAASDGNCGPFGTLIGVLVGFVLWFAISVPVLEHMDVNSKLISSVEYKIEKINGQYWETDRNSRKIVHYVDEGVDTGEINAIKVLDLFRMEIEQLEFPVKFEDYFSMTNAYIQGKNVYYEYTFELEISASDFSDADILEMKKEIINGLIEANISSYKKDMAKEGVKLYTIYKNIKGEEIARIMITADDL